MAISCKGQRASGILEGRALGISEGEGVGNTGGGGRIPEGEGVGNTGGESVGNIGGGGVGNTGGGGCREYQRGRAVPGRGQGSVAAGRPTPARGRIHTVESRFESGVSESLRVNSEPEVNLTPTLDLRTPQRGKGSQTQISENPSVDSTADPQALQQDCLSFKL